MVAWAVDLAAAGAVEKVVVERVVARAVAKGREATMAGWEELEGGVEARAALSVEAQWSAVSRISSLCEVRRCIDHRSYGKVCRMETDR